MASVVDDLQKVLEKKYAVRRLLFQATRGMS